MSKLFKIALGMMVLLVLLSGFKYALVPATQTPVLPKGLTLQTGTALPTPKHLPHFQLIDVDKYSFSNKQLQGQWSFVFFGYTHCPGICPATLGKLNELATLLGPSSASLTQFVFVTIDPLNDTPSRLKTYFAQPEFKKAHFIGTTGSLQDIQALAKVIGLFVSEDNIPVNGHIEHSGTVLLINPDGQLAAVFSNSNQPSGMAKDFKALMHHYHQSLTS